MSSEEEVDYPDHTSESQNSTTSSEDTITEISMTSTSGSPLRTRKNIYPKKTTDIRKNRVAEDGNPANTHPVGRVQQKTTTKAHQSETKTSNSYQILQTNDAEQEQNDSNNHRATQNEENDNNNPQTQQKTIGYSPLIVIHQRMGDTKVLIEMLKNSCTEGFSIKHGNNTTNIQIKSRNQHGMVSRWLEQQKIGHHTYTAPENKNHAFVLEGLDNAATEHEIKDELIEEHNIEVKEVYKMRNTRIPKYLIITDKNMTISKISKIRFVNYTKIVWRRYYNKWEAIQCKRCLRWGHATSNCKGVLRCNRCAKDNHSAKDCPEPAADTAVKCANCHSTEHPARSEECPIYQAIIEKRHRRYTQYLQQSNTQQQYLPAPPPKFNVWEERRARGRIEQQQDIPREEQPYLAPPPQFNNWEERRIRVNHQQERPRVEQPLPIMNPRDWPVPGRIRQEEPRPETRPIAREPQIQEQFHPGMGNNSNNNNNNNSNNNSNNFTSTLNELNELSSEIAKLNSQVNIKRFINNLKKLNAALASANDQMQKLDIMLNFATFINVNGC